MAAAAAGIFSHSLTAGSALSGTTKTASPLAASTGGTSSTSSSSTSSASISANDFLTLLVTEMQNQDPTATQDPNEYINQLVQVNSLEQLIDINQNLSTALGTGSTSSGTTGKDAPAAGASSNVAGASAATGAHATAATHKNALAAAQAAQNAASASPAAANVVPSRMAPGNLSVPKTNASAQRVGHALSGQAHANTMPGGTYRTQ